MTEEQTPPTVVEDPTVLPELAPAAPAKPRAAKSAKAKPRASKEAPGRATRLYLTDAAAQSGEYFGLMGIPARDLEPEEVAALTDDEYETITNRPKGLTPIYQKSKPATRDAADTTP